MAEQRLAFEVDTIRQAQNGSQEAFRTLYERYTDAIYRYIYKKVGESSEAEDLTQAVFVKAWQALRDYQVSGAPFQAWLYRIAHNAVVDHYRTRREPLLWDDLAWVADPHSTPEAGAIQAEQQAVVHRALAELRPAYRDVLTRRFLHNMDYAETAADLGQQVNNIRVLQHRALEALRRVLSSENALRLGSVIAVLCLLLGRQIVVAAEQALPGDRLYPVRTVTEDVRLFLATDADDVRLHTAFATQRLAALTALMQANRSADLTTLVADLAEHLQAATTTFRALTQAGASQPALTAAFSQAVEQQAATLQTLTTGAAPAVQTAIQPALKAVAAAQQVLPATTPNSTPPKAVAPTAVAPAVERSPATPTPLPTATATLVSTATPTASPVAPTRLAPTAQPTPRADSSPQRSTADQKQISGRRQFPTPSATQPQEDQAAAAPVRAARSAAGPTTNQPRTERAAAPPAQSAQTGPRPAADPAPASHSSSNPDQAPTTAAAGPREAEVAAAATAPPPEQRGDNPAAGSSPTGPAEPTAPVDAEQSRQAPADSHDQSEQPAPTADRHGTERTTEQPASSPGEAPEADAEHEQLKDQPTGDQAPERSSDRADEEPAPSPDSANPSPRPRP